VGQLNTGCCHLAGEVLDTLLKCVAVGEWHDPHESWLGCGLDDAVCTVARSVQATLRLAGGNGPYVGGVGGWTRCREGSHLGRGSRVVLEMGQFEVAHLECKELTVLLLS
jgi:hypothetical protein